MARRTLASLRALAQSDDPFADSAGLVARLLSATSESTHLEWKLELPFGPAATLRTKYRTVKAAISFANWEGGFIVFGVDPGGQWRGLTREALKEVDPAKLIELVNGCIAPELSHLGYHTFQHRSKSFAVLHVPPSPLAPHITTKALQDKTSGGEPKVVVLRHALYARRGAQSDLANPAQHQKIIDRRVQLVRDELVRRVREVPVAAPQHGSATQLGRTVMLVRTSTDPSAPAVRVVHDSAGTHGSLVHEELSDGLFDEINNIVDANFLLAKGGKRFVFEKDVYYRIYAERHHLSQTSAHIKALAHIGLEEVYGPFLYWALRLSDEDLVTLLVHSTSVCRSPNIYGTYRLACVLGRPAIEWLVARLDRRWGRHPQRPDFYWTLKEHAGKPGADAVASALRVGTSAVIDMQWRGERQSAEALLADPSTAGSLLSEACMRQYRDGSAGTTTIRQLDIAAYAEGLVRRRVDVATRIAALPDEAGAIHH